MNNKTADGAKNSRASSWSPFHFFRTRFTFAAGVFVIGDVSMRMKLHSFF
jgi:hypothetical protein